MNRYCDRLEILRVIISYVPPTHTCGTMLDNLQIRRKFNKISRFFIFCALIRIFNVHDQIVLSDILIYFLRAFTL